MNKITTIFLMVLSLFPAAGLAESAVPDTVILSLAKSEALTPALRTMHLDFLMEREGRVYIVATEEDRLKLQSAGIA
ncbi:MAG: hypothetical protein MUP19_04085, partial [Candidatus Aminicenantes bacterium]|nr:hypothetical protein [Candidatus Aminicenantes bacterium]